MQSQKFCLEPEHGFGIVSPRDIFCIDDNRLLFQCGCHVCIHDCDSGNLQFLTAAPKMKLQNPVLAIALCASKRCVAVCEQSVDASKFEPVATVCILDLKLKRRVKTLVYI
jgi:hypothetical protein